MDHLQIKLECEKLVKAFTAKGWKNPSAFLKVRANEELLLGLSAEHPVSEDYKDSCDIYIRGTDPATLFRQAYVDILALPDEKTAAEDEFRRALARTIEIGKRNGIDVDFVNPLIEQMKRLSENILTHNGEA